MRIAMVSEHASPLAVIGGVDAGGQNVHVAALATELGALGHDVVVHTRRDAPDLPRQVRFAPGVSVHHVDAGPPRRLPKDDLLEHMGAFARELAKAWGARPPEVVHAHFWMSGLAALAAARAFGIPVVHTFHALGTVKRRHQGAADTSPPERLALEARVARDADRIVATCHDEVAELARMGADPARVAVVPCGVDTARFRPHGPADPRPPGVQRVLTVGRLVPRKGVDDVIAALADVPAAELVVAGGPDRSALERDPAVQRLRTHARRCGVAERIDWRGSVAREHMPALLRSADVVVATPWYEPFGIVPVEAAACGVPVVASAVGGMLDTVVDGVTGLHVPPRSPAALAGALRRLLDDPAARAERGRAAARRAHQRYGWGRIAAQTLGAYEEVVAPHALAEVAS
jgi:D-inositol-3-phosphate glycosyltransferase